MRWAHATPTQAAELLGELGAPEPAERALDRLARAAWSVLIEPGDAVAGMLIAAHGPREALERAVTGDISGAGIDPEAQQAALGRWRPRMADTALESVLRVARAARAQLLVPEDAAWPGALADLGPHMPVCLWARGVPEALRRTAGTDWHVAELELAL
ncbi:hypothetical protein GCM10009808_05570 [Microbacterium sediminicola]|uniref:Uncharacterized protein n=1 Tax=Microbacterium sediminicola TaxID=415210 RepID=A0ABN2HPV2_9MICO